MLSVLQLVFTCTEVKACNNQLCQYLMWLLSLSAYMVVYRGLEPSGKLDPAAQLVE